MTKTKKQNRRKVSTSFAILPEDREALKKLGEAMGIGVNGMIEGAIKHLLNNPDEIRCPTCDQILKPKEPSND